MKSEEMGLLQSLLHFCGLICIIVMGKIRDAFRKLHDALGVNPTRLARRTPPGYAPLSTDFDSFYTRRFYKRIEDVFNRPIDSAPDAWMTVMERDMRLAVDGATPTCVPTGTSRRCLNLASYNYLGFANQDPYCTPRVLASLKKYGASTCSASLDGGTTEVLRELEDKVASFVHQVRIVCTLGCGEIPLFSQTFDLTRF